MADQPTDHLWDKDKEDRFHSSPDQPRSVDEWAEHLFCQQKWDLEEIRHALLAVEKAAEERGRELERLGRYYQVEKDTRHACAEQVRALGCSSAPNHFCGKTHNVVCPIAIADMLEKPDAG